jgi:hypothetical protein
LTLPNDGWNECELKCAPTGTLAAVQSTIQTGDVIRAIFEDTYLISGASSYSSNSQAVIDSSGSFTPAYGAASLRLKFTAACPLSRLNISFIDDTSHIVLLDGTSLTNFAGLHFWIYPKFKVDSFSVELTSTNATGQLVETSVPLTNYLAATDFTNQWKEVVIPFADFPNTGFYYSGGVTNSTPFPWDRLSGIGFYCSTVVSGFYDPHVDEINIIYATLP